MPTHTHNISWVPVTTVRYNSCSQTRWLNDCTGSYSMRWLYVRGHKSIKCIIIHVDNWIESMIRVCEPFNSSTLWRSVEGKLIKPTEILRYSAAGPTLVKMLQQKISYHLTIAAKQKWAGYQTPIVLYVFLALLWWHSFVVLCYLLWKYGLAPLHNSH